MGQFSDITCQRPRLHPPHFNCFSALKCLFIYRKPHFLKIPLNLIFAGDQVQNREPVGIHHPLVERLKTLMIVSELNHIVNLNVTLFSNFIWWLFTFRLQTDLMWLPQNIFKLGESKHLPCPNRAQFPTSGCCCTLQLTESSCLYHDTCFF